MLVYIADCAKWGWKVVIDEVPYYFKATLPVISLLYLCHIAGHSLEILEYFFPSPQKSR